MITVFQLRPMVVEHRVGKLSYLHLQGPMHISSESVAINMTSAGGHVQGPTLTKPIRNAI